MIKKFCANEVCLSGKVVKKPEYHHTNRECEYFELYVSSQRNSGTEDVLPVIVSKEKIEGLNIEVGKYVRIKGDYRSYSNHDNGKLILYVFVKSIEVCEQEYSNTISFEGYVCKKGNLRVTPLNKKRILDLMLAINRSENKSSYIPCVVWGLHEDKADELSVGDKLRISGRIQSREYQKALENGDTETRIAYEVSVKNFSKCE